MIVIQRLPMKTEREYSIFIENTMTTMNDSEILEKYQQPFPVSFKVIGIGSGMTGIIENVKSFGYECVSCLVAKDSADCSPIDEDKMAIIVTKDDVTAANKIAKTYHDAGVLTIGLVCDPNMLATIVLRRSQGMKNFPG